MEFSFEEIEQLKQIINTTKIMIKILVVTNVITLIAYFRK